MPRSDATQEALLHQFQYFITRGIPYFLIKNLHLDGSIVSGSLHCTTDTVDFNRTISHHPACAISPIPVREALRLLHSEELIEYKPHVGAIVAPISKESIVETFTVIEGLETVATRMAAQGMTTEDVRQLEELLAEMDGALQRGSYEAWGELNTRFHATITDMTAIPMLKEMSKRVLDKWDRIRRYFFNEVLVHRIFRSQQEHCAIVRAIAEHNSERAEQLARDHNRNALKHYMEHLSKKDKK